MSERHHKAIVITDWWAKIIGTLLTVSLIGTFTFALNAYAQQAIMQEKIKTLEEAKLPERMIRIEETVKNTSASVDDVKAMQRTLNGKIDQLIASRK